MRVGITRDFLKPDGTLDVAGMGLELLMQQPNLEWEVLAENTSELRADQVADYDALLLLGGKITSATLPAPGRLRLIARFGVGYDNVDVAACTRAGVLLTITPDGVRRPVAAAALTLLLALSHKLLIKDRLTRTGRWQEILDHMGMGLTGRTLGVIGLGNIGREVFQLARPLQMQHIAHDPYVVTAGPEVELLALDELLRRSDFVCICCALSEQTRGLIDAERLALMKPSAYLINVARGPIVDQAALTAALCERRIQGAGLDVFQREPIEANDPLLQLDNVIVSPHALCWTDECFRGIGGSACRSIIDVVNGRMPTNVVNPEVIRR